MDYVALKASHAGFAYLSILLFVIRFGLFSFKPMLRSNLVLKILPHLIDTALIVLAVLLSMQMMQYPFVHGWLTAKVLALVAYIGLGVVAIKRGNVMAFIAAVLIFVYMIAVAKSKTAMPWSTMFGA